MADEKPKEPEAVQLGYDIQGLLKYSGPDFRQREQIDGVTLFDFKNTDENERNISLLLSSQEIRFNIERPQLGWTGTEVRMLITVPVDQADRTTVLLDAAVNAGVVERAEEKRGLYSR